MRETTQFQPPDTSMHGMYAPTVRPDVMDPSDVEKSLGVNPLVPAPPSGSPPAPEGRTAGPGAPPMPDQGQPPLPEKAPLANPQDLPPQLVSTEDTRYGDPQWIIISNLVTQGALPWLQAATDVAAGRVPTDQFDAARQEHQQRVNDIMDSHPDFVKAAENAMPFLSGLALGIGGKGEKLATTIGKGFGAGAAQGFVQGYTSGPVEEPSVSGNRVAQGIGRGVETGVIGMAGAIAPRAAYSIQKRLEQQAIKKAEQEAAGAADREAQAAQQKKAQTQQKRTQTRATNKAEKERLGVLADKYEERYKYPPNPYMEHTPEEKRFIMDNRRLFAHDPVRAFTAAAGKGMNLEGFARYVDLPQGVVASRLSGVKLPYDTPQQKSIMAEMWDVYKTQEAYMKLGRGGAQNARSSTATSSAGAGSTGSEPGTGPAAPATSAPAGSTAAPTPARKQRFYDKPSVAPYIKGRKPKS
jgi:hypothetical protein